ncbi:MAG: hypothetical protein ACD_4C00238G0013 [uncultured bacterium (gcode 4)]|uniref:Uncharacterized protein n=1 Tax=uncultured bacterium (gcode 4) TaxID=1234023 RepID=K2G8Y0_9BACT|nr:MAG: hypothetical protein ACD_4C00238G0013 [uncultured bacterium (gcode 4)]
MELNSNNCENCPQSKVIEQELLENIKKANWFAMGILDGCKCWWKELPVFEHLLKKYQN